MREAGIRTYLRLSQLAWITKGCSPEHLTIQQAQRRQSQDGMTRPPWERPIQLQGCGWDRPGSMLVENWGTSNSSSSDAGSCGRSRFCTVNLRDIDRAAAIGGSLPAMQIGVVSGIVSGGIAHLAGGVSGGMYLTTIAHLAVSSLKESRRRCFCVEREKIWESIPGRCAGAGHSARSRKPSRRKPGLRSRADAAGWSGGLGQCDSVGRGIWSGHRISYFVASYIA